jgi:hypothetical protein
VEPRWRDSLRTEGGDTDDFTANGGIVQFKMKDAHIRIELDTGAAERANLRISSRLLSLADPARH